MSSNVKQPMRISVALSMNKYARLKLIVSVPQFRIPNVLSILKNNAEEEVNRSARLLRKLLMSSNAAPLLNKFVTPSMKRNATLSQTLSMSSNAQLSVNSNVRLSMNKCATQY